jgi:predicted GNAT family acetyltransferase
MATTVIDDRSKSRYELLVDDVAAGFADYELIADRIAVVHVEVDRQLGGHGLGRQLVDGVLDDARRRGLFVLPRLPERSSPRTKAPTSIWSRSTPAKSSVFRVQSARSCQLQAGDRSSRRLGPKVSCQR